jgi:hypothetical protein
VTSCPTCGRRRRARRIAAPTAQLAFTWPPPPPPSPPTPRPVARQVRLLLLHACPDAEGQPRPALLPAGACLPILFDTIAAALATKRAMEAAL